MGAQLSYLMKNGKKFADACLDSFVFQSFACVTLFRVALALYPNILADGDAKLAFWCGTPFVMAAISFRDIVDGKPLKTFWDYYASLGTIIVTNLFFDWLSKRNSA